jgi:hypothetical protein
MAQMETKLQAIQSYVAEQQGQIVRTQQGAFNGAYPWELERDRTYRVFVVTDRNLEDVQVKMQIYQHAMVPPEKKMVAGVECYSWYLMLFQQRYIHLTLQLQASAGTRGVFTIIIATAGREPAPSSPFRGVDADRHVYELFQNTMYKDGQKQYQIRDTIARVYVTPNGHTYLLTTEGTVLSQNMLIYKGSQYKDMSIVKIVCAYDDRVYLFRSDSAVLNSQGNIVYKRTGEERAVDIIEDGWSVWVATQNGKRIKL